MPGNETSLVLAYILYLACPCCNTCQPLMFAIKLWFHCAAWISSYQPHAYIVPTGSWLHTTGSSQQIHQEGSQLQLGFGFPHKEPRILRYIYSFSERISQRGSVHQTQNSLECWKHQCVGIIFLGVIGPPLIVPPS